MAVDPTTGEVIEEEKAAVSVLDLSDEDFNNLPVTDTPEYADPEPDNANTDSGSTGSDDAGDVDVDPTLATGAAGADSDENGSADQVAVEKVVDPEKPADAEAPAVNYEEEYKKLIQPFKANGGEIQVKDTDEILTLMQMGANYHKKMSALKPTMKMVKLLERHGLLDETKLGYLIDLSKKDPAAIQQLVKDSGINPMDIDVDSDSTYSPKVAPVSDVEMQLHTVLEDIQDTPMYARTLQVVTDTWDEVSRTAAVANPQIIKVINDQIGSGIYDKVMGEVARARQFGKLQGISDFDAYKQVGDWMSNQGMLQPKPSAPVKTNIEADAQKKKDDEKRSAQRKAAGAPPVKKSVAPVAAKSGVLGMSDEEFLKLPASAYTKIK